MFDDRGLAEVMASFGVTAGQYLGHGGEAVVFALGDDRVLRVLHEGGRIDHLTRRQALVDELAQGRPAFALPQLLDVGERHGVYAIEARLAGRTVADELGAGRTARAPLIEAHLDAFTGNMLTDGSRITASARRAWRVTAASIPSPPRSTSRRRRSRRSRPRPTSTWR